MSAPRGKACFPARNPTRALPGAGRGSRSGGKAGAPRPRIHGRGAGEEDDRFPTPFAPPTRTAIARPRRAARSPPTPIDHRLPPYPRTEELPAARSPMRTCSRDSTAPRSNVMVQLGSPEHRHEELAESSPSCRRDRSRMNESGAVDPGGALSLPTGPPPGGRGGVATRVRRGLGNGQTAAKRDRLENLASGTEYRQEGRRLCERIAAHVCFVRDDGCCGWFGV